MGKGKEDSNSWEYRDRECSHISCSHDKMGVCVRLLELVVNGVPHTLFCLRVKPELPCPRIGCLVTTVPA